METVFITGGSGTVGAAFIEAHYNTYKFISYSRNEKMQVALKRKFPDIEIELGSVEDCIGLKRAVQRARPDIVIHAAALKHVDTAERSPIAASKVNVVGTMNVVEACVDKVIEPPAKLSASSLPSIRSASVTAGRAPHLP